MTEGYGSRCKDVRVALGYGLLTWSRRVGFNESSVSRWENGLQPPSHYLTALTKFGVNGHWLLTGQGTMWGEGDPNATANWLRRVGLPEIADASPAMAMVVKMAESGGVSASRLVKEQNLSQEAAEALLSAAITNLGLKRGRGGRFFPIGDTRIARTETAATILGLLEHLPEVLRPAIAGSPVGVRFGKLRIIPGSHSELWSKLVEPIDSRFAAEPPTGEEVQYVVVMTAQQKEQP